MNKDSIRFMMLNRSNDVELEFDFDKVLESKDNPVFYVQYCHARIQSILRSVDLKLIKSHKLKILTATLISLKEKFSKRYLNGQKL